MDIYKTQDDPINDIECSPTSLDLPQIIPNVNLFNSEFQNILRILQSEDGTDYSKIFSFIKNLGPIFEFPNLIPTIIESGMLFSLLDKISVSPIDIFDILFNLTTCSFDDLQLLIANGLFDSLLSELTFQDPDVNHNILNIFSHIFSIKFSILEQNYFLFCLISSTHIIDIIYLNLKQCDFEQKIELMPSISKFMVIFCEKGMSIPHYFSINFDSISHKFDQFLSNCSNAKLFDQDLFHQILQNGISFEKNNLFYNIFIEMLSTSIPNPLYPTDPNSVYYSLIFTFYFLQYQPPSFFLFFDDDINIFQYFHQWINLHSQKVFYSISLAISQLFNLGIGHQLSDQCYESCYTTSVSIFDFYQNEFDSKTTVESNQEVSAVAAITNLFVSRPNFIIKFLDNENRIQQLIKKVLEGTANIGHGYAYLILTIASRCDHYRLLLTPEIFDKIFQFMSKLDGAFVDFALDSFERMFEKHSNNQDFLTFFVSNNGCDMILELMDSENESISKRAVELYDKYLKEQ